jgi:outer membrane protein
MKQVYLIGLILLPMLAGAQVADTQPKVFTLDESTAYALENSVDVNNASLDEKIAVARVRETRGIGLPQVNGSVSVVHNQKLPRFFATKQTAFGFSGLDASEYPNFYPDLEDDDVVASQNFFQLKSSGDANIRVDQLIFNGSYLVGLQAANAYKELTVRSSNQTKEQVIEKVKKAFYGALINKERILLFDNNIARVDSLLRNTRAMNKNGFAESIDVDRIQVTLNNLVTERDKFMNLQALSLELLKFQMNYPMDQPIDVTGDLASITVTDDLERFRQDWDYSKRSDYSVLMANKRLQELNVKNNYAAGLPNLSAFANLGYSTQSPNIGGIFKTESDMSDNGQFGPDKWYSYSSFGVSLNVPIFSGLQRSYKLQQEKLALLKIENSFRTMKSGIDLEIKTATINYENALKSVASQKANMDLAANIARVTKIKYEQGVGSNFEVIEAESSLKEAQVNYYNALYDAVVAKTDLEKAYGKLLTK